MQTDVITSPASSTPRTARASVGRNRWETRIAIATVLVFGLALSGVLLFALTSSTPLGTQISTATFDPHGPPRYPVGTVAATEPSGLAPPSMTALKGYHRVYTTDFPGSTLPPGWVDFTGQPGGDLESKFRAANVIVEDGTLRLTTTSRGPLRWYSGGLCQCGRRQLFGAFFVRSRITNAGPNEVELLWPSNNQWPPEIDFNESGSRWSATSGTVHFETVGGDRFIQQNFPGIDLRRWHTWGVIWTPTSVTYTVDGYQWGEAVRTPGVIPQIPMTLDLQQRPSCTPGASCPNQDQTMLVDWVAEYAPS